ncbi:hypothetical protein BCR34DRAFT_610710 [Clohesyomyces aquaticus]|uniref:Uncharacterized protein n=1 Tax=Clohesyomyces aquaticus TaxID=1231657 RepID=A0A1Y2A666_9PLEO|nr:hypothetical protein BCR34DRAFT_610710 [Clohesyomyces aquaticus]
MADSFTQPFLTHKHEDDTSRHSVDSYEPGSYHVPHPASKGDHHHRQGSEKPKIALHRKLPKRELIVHATSIGIIGILFWLNGAQIYSRDFDLEKDNTQNQQLKGGQLPAKLHELLMLASLSYVVFYHMRKLLLGRNGIPFGLVSAPYMTNSPSMLAKTSFWAGSRRHWPFGALLGLVCILSVVLGPSSAILMIPSLSWFDDASTIPARSSKIYLPGRKEDLWPSVFNASRMSNTTARNCRINPLDVGSFTKYGLACPTMGYMEIYEWLLSRILTDSKNALVFRELFSNTQRQVEIATLPRNHSSTAKKPAEAYMTVATELATRSLGAYYNYMRRQNRGGLEHVAFPRLRTTAHSADSLVYQPVVHVNCQADLYDHGDKSAVKFPSVQSRWVDDGAYEQDPFILEADTGILDGSPVTEPQFSWYKDTREKASSSLLALAIVPVKGSNDTNPEYQSSATVACSIDARWAASDASYQPANSSIVSSNVSDALLHHLVDNEDRTYSPSLQAQYGLSEKPIDLQLDWAAILNGNQSEHGGNGTATKKSAFAIFLGLNSSNNVKASQDPSTTMLDQLGAIEKAVSVLLGVVIANGISRPASWIQMPMILDNSTTTHDGLVPLLFPTQPEETEFFGPTLDNVPLYVVSLKLDRYGYGYSFRNTASRLAMVVLSLYAGVVCTHVVYILASITTKRYAGGSCWHNVGDLVALAVNSPPTDKLYGTSAGIAESGTWRHMVRVHPSGDEHLELSFVRDGPERAGSEIQVNKRYY